MATEKYIKERNNAFCDWCGKEIEGKVFVSENYGFQCCCSEHLMFVEQEHEDYLKLDCFLAKRR